MCSAHFSLARRCNRTHLPRAAYRSTSTSSARLYTQGEHAMSRMLIVGSGVVGQATGKGFTKKGHTVGYVDINPQTIAKLRGDGLNAMMASEVDWNAVDVVLLAVSTPSVNDRIVLDYIEAAALDV